MTVQDMVAEIPKLSLEERLMPLDAITRSLRDPITPSHTTSVVDRLYGAFQMPGQDVSDADLDRLRFDSIMEKHGP